ncbi:Uncharacterised protein [Algoriella xinjiangensis]|uniref:hypothetical protein n=1 Tax=Algoriella xinjiangensis TaxID=684065 RepID=UPI000F632C85|nr:hypothetical protein [Algoriella xinjiangensis]VDH16150.1 Uncharacterised protein [Algoriella xinjiangensis]
MKKYLLVTTLFLTTFLNAQTEFNYTIEGLTPKALVVEVFDIKQADVYRNALGWVKETYKNPDIVIKSTIENNKIRFEGVTSNAYCIKVFGMDSCEDVKYLIDLEFKDGKYRIEPIKFEYYVKPNQYLPSNLSGFRNFNLSNGEDHYNRKKELRSNSKVLINDVLKVLNQMNLDLKSYIESDSSNKLNADW